MTTARTIHRLITMGRGELQERATQALSTFRERWQRPLSDDAFAESVAQHVYPGLQQPLEKIRARLLANFCHRSTPAFFVSRREIERLVEAVRQRFPHQVTQTLASADRVSVGRLDLLGLKDLACGSPPRWHRDPTTGCDWPVVFWSTIDPLAAEAPGDSKIIWELNRHQYFPVLGKAYLITGDDRYAAVFVQHALDWISNNPPNLGINWTSSLELAFRCISWLWAMFLLSGSPAYTADVHFALLKSIEQQMTHVAAHLSHYFSPNTHLTGEALGLFYVGVLLPELPSSHQWGQLGWRIIAEQAQRQIMPDHMHFERSSCYLKYTLSFYLHAYLLALQNSIDVPEDLIERLRGLLHAASCFVCPNGEAVNCGDDDGGVLLNLDGQRPRDLRSLLSTGAALFRDPLFRARAGGVREESLWLLGAERATAIDNMTGQSGDSFSQALPLSGFYSLRDSGQANADFLFFNGGTELPHLEGHTHADSLSVDVTVRGAPVLVDVGTFSYATVGNWRNRFRGALAHNVVVINGEAFSEPARHPFRWERKATARTEKIYLHPEFDYVQASVGTTASKEFPFCHHRRVIFLKRAFWLIHDWVEGTRNDVELQWLFHAAPGDILLIEDSAVAEIRTEAGGELSVVPVGTEKWNLSCTKGDEKTGPWVSTEYGLRRAAPVLSYKRRFSMPAMMGFLLLPSIGVVQRPTWSDSWSGRTLPSGQALRFCYADTEYILLSNFCSTPLEWEGWFLDGDFALLAKRHDATWRAWAIRANCLRKEGATWFASAARQDGPVNVDAAPLVNQSLPCAEAR